jgi:hypothetical protein
MLNAPYHSIYFGAPLCSIWFISSKSIARFNAATNAANAVTPIERAEVPIRKLVPPKRLMIKSIR